MPEITPSLIGELAIWYVVFLFSLTFHEYGHAQLAHWGGDDTAYQGGQVSLDPLPHLRRSPFGMIFMPLITFIWAGWMMGWASTPFDPTWGKRHPGRQALMSLAGPFCNFLLAALALVGLRLLLAEGVFIPPDSVSFSRLVDVPDGGPGSPMHALAMGLSIMLNLNVLLGLFNLLPIPPLDGAGIVEGLAPQSAGRFYEMLRETPMAQIMGLFVAWRVFAFIAGPAFTTILQLVHPAMRYS